MPSDPRLKKLLITITFYGMAMAFLESAVVVYLREIYYPNGFDFPMVPMSNRIAITEILREASTMVMLISVAYMAGTTLLRRFAWFIFCFAVWDIFYYVFLKLLIGWPSSFLTWDILFLIPVVWTGPVIAPILLSLTMIGMALIILTGRISSKVRSHWLVLLGAFVLFLSFIWDFSGYMLDRYSISEIFKPGVSRLAIGQYVPYRFNWWFFITGELMVLAGIFLAFHNPNKIENEV